MNILLLLLCLYFTVTDLKRRIIPNFITHPLLVILIIWRLISFESSYLFALLPALIYLIMFFIQPSIIGAGDIKLIAIMGLCIGLSQTLLVIALSAICSIPVLVWMRARHGKFDEQIPLAPYLTFGLLVIQIAVWTDVVTI